MTISTNGILCDFCGKRPQRYVTIEARNLKCSSWGWFEGHWSCIQRNKHKPLQALKFGKVRWRNQRN